MLRQLMIAKQIEQRKNALNELVQQEDAFKVRSEELEAAIEEAQTDEEITAVTEEVEKLEAEQAELKEKKTKLEEEIAELENELEQLKSKEPKNDPPPANPERGKEQGGEVRMKRGFFAGMNRGEVDALIAREEVREFLQRTRELATQKRAVTGGDLLIPDVMLGLLRDNIALSSKLLTKVNYKPLKGTARQNITGTVPEAVWTEMVGALNELEISFNQVEVDGYKVGGFVVIPNSTLQDSDISLASEILTQISKAIGIALDKAILYGLGVKQPLGIATRLAQTSAPSGYPANAPAWEDLRTSNIKKLTSTGAALIGDIIGAFAACKNDYSDGRKFHAMNSVTYAYLMSTLLNFNAAGALVTGMQNQMPVLGGDIVILDFMPNYDIISGYGDLYLLVEREGTVLASSEHVKFIEDQTVFKGLARYDGLPVIAKGFVLMNIKNANATTTATFEFDYANTGLGELTVTSEAGTSAGDTKIKVSGHEASGTTIAYKSGIDVAKVYTGMKKTTAWLGFGDEPNFTTGVNLEGLTADHLITVVEFDAKGKAIKAGVARIVVNTSS
jgi:HK97 family phage major capsid protein